MNPLETTAPRRIVIRYVITSIKEKIESATSAYITGPACVIASSTDWECGTMAASAAAVGAGVGLVLIVCASSGAAVTAAISEQKIFMPKVPYDRRCAFGCKCERAIYN